ncbi:hypothetical protein KSP39_PZI018584 [Platanthera zijinensis]|uniref:Nodulin-like domain-containing protein n=1 Tax=Platanthera zijinensis TaxID=2320716 RepID=A0AAP0FYI1_9ASPA
MTREEVRELLEEEFGQIGYRAVQVHHPVRNGSSLASEVLAHPVPVEVLTSGGKISRSRSALTVAWRSSDKRSSLIYGSATRENLGQASSMSVLPWLTLATVIWLQAIADTNTDFSAYSSELKTRLGISQVKLNYLAVASDAGKFFGWCAGAATFRLPLWSVLAVGATLGAAGYGVQFLYFCRKISALSYAQFFFLNMLNGNSICWLNTTGYTAVRRQFLLADHGAVFALTTSYTGLTANIYLSMAETVIGKSSVVRGDKSVYLLLNAVTPVAVALFTMPTLAAMRPRPADMKAGLVTMFGIAGVTGAYTVIQTTLPAMRSSSGTIPATVLMVMVTAVVVVPVVKAGKWVMRGGKEEAEKGAAKVVDVEGGGKVVAQEAVTGTEGNVNSVWVLVKKVTFWVYFLVYLCGATLGVVYGNHLGQISKSRHVSDSILLSVSSSFGFFGRLATAPLSVFSRSKYKISNTGTIAVLMVAMSVSFFLLLCPGDAFLFVSTAVIGLCSGAISSIAVSVTSELFGQENFPVNHNIVLMNIPIGSFLFGTIAAVIYDKAGGKEGEGRHGLCIGMACYSLVFIIWGCICSLGAILSFVLFSRTGRSFVSRR